MTTTSQPAKASGEFRIAGTLPVTRLGFGAMRITGPGVWGDPKDPDEAVRTLRRAVERGVNFIDTADAYGPFVSELLINKALRPYQDDLVIATKAGFTRSGPGDWRAVGRPEYLRQQVELSLRHLGLEQIALLQLHRIDPKVPLADQIGELKLMRDEGKIAHIGLSAVTVEEIEKARAIAEIASVQNRYNLADRFAESVLDYSAANSIAFIPWNPLAIGKLAEAGGQLQVVSDKHGATPSQLALAWLLRRSPVMLPIPGTSTAAHVEENIAAAEVTLTDAEFQELQDAVN
ncbi:MAG TPA: aldo/keto reductase [Pseudonocardiaceae bacterium]|jgi:aryl-alcohol dehydrogenase-like predicted oxidoreductase|nr:aldo/keto reductase [Pseudonocardiaceae bacterium]